MDGPTAGARARLRAPWLRLARWAPALLAVAAVVALSAVLVAPRSSVASDDRVSGTPRAWHPLTVDFSGPLASETDSRPNPFLDYRLQVTFTGPSGQVYAVPGFFDGNGNGGGTGNVWRARFTPDEPGRWSYEASFRAGPGVAIELDAQAGEPAAFDGASGWFDVEHRDESAPGFLKWGRLEYVGGHYLKFRQGPYWLKGGTNSPENLLGYVGFDDSPLSKHVYEPHARDWQAGDPSFTARGADHGRGLIGALNYLASRHVNSVYFLPLNIGGDGRDTWPFVSSLNAQGHVNVSRLNYDISKLRQWEQVFAHAQRQGILLHFVLDEAEPSNRTVLDGGTLGAERKLFYRELVARFAHHNALQWNVSEEYDGVVSTQYGIDYPGIPVESVKAYAGYLEALDPYDHPITVHHWRDPAEVWTTFLGDGRFSLTSLQYGDRAVDYGAEVEQWRGRSRAVGKPIPVSLDEVRSLSTANATQQRKEILWPVYLSGGQLEWFIAAEDQSLEDFRPFEPMWNYTWYARKFIETHLPFWEMEPQDGRLSGESARLGEGQVLVKPGEVFAVYLPEAATAGTLDLADSAGAFEKRWYDPRTGQFAGTAETVCGGGPVPLGRPPYMPEEDWALLLTARAGEPCPPVP
jgi:hypothetical protein